MKVQVYADDALVYSSGFDEYELLELTVTNNVNTTGVATLTMPPGHPAYNSFIAYKTVVTIYRDDVLLFRGRALHPSDNFYNERTITCEGEQGFLQDAIMRPYMYQDAPAAIFEHVIGLYNAQVDSFKQFAVGEITVTDPNNYIRFENEKAEQMSDTIAALVERVGGYIVFTQDPQGGRVINWLAELNYRSYQAIEFGENLLDYARSDGAEELATVLVPYGAKIETTDEVVDDTTGDTTTETAAEYVTIESVNEGRDFIQDYEAVALRGVIARSVYWDDVTEPANLLAKAQQYLAEHRLVVTTLELSAVDLSALDADIDTFQEGDTIRVRSKPHGVDEDFLLQERSYNLLNPAADTVVLGKDVSTLTGSAAASDRQTSSELAQVRRDIRADYQLNIDEIIKATELTLTSLIEQTSESLRLEVAEQYAKGDEVQSLIATSMTQLADSFTFTFTELQQVVDENNAYARDKFVESEKYIRFEDGTIILGEEGNQLILRQENDRISFLDSGAEVAYFSNKQLYVTDAHFLNSLVLGSFAWVPRANGNLSLVKRG